MTSLTTFPHFPLLPAELRLKIWRHALPKRVLQLGIDIPFPFLRKYANNIGRTERWLLPIPSRLPSIFHVCHDSRAICLEEYIPFGCSYMHPSLDTLYISRLAGTALYHNMCKMHGAARPSLYPLALLDRVVMEIWDGDVPRKAGRGVDLDVCSTVVEHLWLAVSQFGPPKELLIVRTEDTGNIWKMSGLPGYGSVEITEMEPEQPWAVGKVEELVGFVRHRLQVGSDTNPWLQWRIPEIKCVGGRREGSAMREWVELEKWLPVGDRAVERWKREVWELNEADWEWDLHGNPYYRENMEKALAHFRQGLKGGLVPIAGIISDDS